jgi:hypothetical protein
MAYWHISWIVQYHLSCFLIPAPSFPLQLCWPWEFAMFGHGLRHEFPVGLANVNFLLTEGAKTGFEWFLDMQKATICIANAIGIILQPHTLASSQGTILGEFLLQLQGKYCCTMMSQVATNDPVFGWYEIIGKLYALRAASQCTLQPFLSLC